MQLESPRRSVRPIRRRGGAASFFSHRLPRAANNRYCTIGAFVSNSTKIGTPKKIAAEIVIYTGMMAPKDPVACETVGGSHRAIAAWSAKTGVQKSNRDLAAYAIVIPLAESFLV